MKPEEVIVDKIYLIRDKKVMLDRDLADLYDVPTKALKQAVKRNYTRFPDDFMFTLSEDEFSNLRSQIVTSSWGGWRTPPFCFTEQGVAMLSSVLNSERAIQMNIQIIRIFTKLKEMALTHKDILLKLQEIESQTSENTADIKAIYLTLREFLKEANEERTKIGLKSKFNETRRYTFYRHRDRFSILKL